MVLTLVIGAVLILGICLYLQHPKFGKKPDGARLQRMRQSPHFKNGKFFNLKRTPVLTEGHNYLEVIYKNVLKSNPRRYPKDSIPAIKSDLRSIPPNSNILVWFGHSSYYLQLGGRRILVDPVFSGNASPLPGTTRAFKGCEIYSVADFPEIDFLFITHDHYDHLDYETVLGLRSKTKKVISGLGVGAHFERWGYCPDSIIEKDWFEKAELDAGLTAFVEPARHFSGRGFIRNNTLWVSYVLDTPGFKIYLGGDSGYDSHYAAIAGKYGGMDLAILDNGQFNEAWKYIHNMPEDVLQAALDLKAGRVLPVHSSKFALASHPWDEPLKRITELNTDNTVSLLTPRIGEVVYLDHSTQKFNPWWTEVN